MDRDKINKRLIIWYAILWALLFFALYKAYYVYFPDTTSTISKWVGLCAGAIALLLAACKALEISFYKSANPMFDKITKYFTNGSFIFVKRLFKISLVFVFFISWLLIKPMGNNFIICFVSGSVFAFVSVLLSVITTSKIATRSSQFYNESNSLALKQIFNSGSIVASLMLGLSIIPLVILYHTTKDYQILNGFVFGASLVAILNNIPTAISKQATKCAQEVVCNHIAQCEKNDRRNPLLLLNGVTKSILGVNLLSCDLFVSFALALVCAMSVGGEFLQLMGAFLPIIVAGSGIFAYVIVVLLTRFDRTKNPLKTLFASAFFVNLLLLGLTYYSLKVWLPDLTYLSIALGAGAFGGFFVCFTHSNYIFSKYRPISSVSNTSISGFIPTLWQTFRESIAGVFLPVIILVCSLLISFIFSGGIEEPSLGLYGIMLSILAMLSSVGAIIGAISFGLTTKNVYTVLDTYEEDICEKENVLSNSLGDVGFHITALGKNFINSATILTSVGAMVAYSILGNLEQIDIMNPYVLVSLLIGSTIPFFYLASIMGIISKTARRLGMEAKEQISRFPQILRLEMRPNYEKCVDLAAVNSSIQVVFATIGVVIIFLLIAKYLMIEALCGFVFGVILSSIGLIYTTSASSVLGKSAKKYFETQFNCIQNTEEYNAISLNEAIFTSFKDLINPTLNALIKFLAVSALALLPLFM
ncbi:MAG: sodium/proton-translocating pyrophosphatase [Candidatus Gastranaerophilales bacterium]|nr:sodium/proton-translocating pyrophosphatase [Candidatus Gastranaerophilales bacterium]